MESWTGAWQQGYCCVSYDLMKKSHRHSCLCMCVVCTCMCACVHVWEGEVFHITHCLVCEVEWIKLSHNLSESLDVPLAWFLVLAMYASLSPLADSSRWCIHKSIPDWCQHELSSKTTTASQGKILCKSQLQSPLSLPKSKQPNLAFLSGRLTSIYLVALRCKGHSSVMM